MERPFVYAVPAKVAETNNQAVTNTTVSIEGHPNYIPGQQSEGN